MLWRRGAGTTNANSQESDAARAGEVGPSVRGKEVRAGEMEGGVVGRVRLGRVEWREARPACGHAECVPH